MSNAPLPNLAALGEPRPGAPRRSLLGLDEEDGGDVLLGSPQSPEPSTARSQLSQSSVASSLSAFSVASSRRKQQRDFFSPVQVLPRVARRR